MKTASFILFVVLAAFSFENQAFAADQNFPMVHVSPSYTSFGWVKAPFTRTTNITFTNMGSEDIQFFNTYCSGDLSVFSCNSSCFQLRRFSSCNVWVTFSPRFGDDMTKWITVQGQGGGAFADAQVYGIDQK